MPFYIFKASNSRRGKKTTTPNQDICTHTFRSVDGVLFGVELVGFVSRVGRLPFLDDVDVKVHGPIVLQCLSQEKHSPHTSTHRHTKCRSNFITGIH